MMAFGLHPSDQIYFCERKRMSAFSRAVKRAFDELIRRNMLSVVEDRHYLLGFGNAVVVLAGANIRVKLVRDRGDIWADATSVHTPDDWAPLERVLKAAGVIGIPEEGLLSVVEAASLVERHFEVLDEALGHSGIEETKKRLAELTLIKKAEARRRFGMPEP
jgi:hypothetical protein